MTKKSADAGGAPTRKAQKAGSAKAPPKEVSAKEYDRELSKQHVELIMLQQWGVHIGFKVCVVFEGRDGAGKGGTINAITERVSPRVFRVVALPAPIEGEKSQMYAQRYSPHLPAAGEDGFGRRTVEVGYERSDVVNSVLPGSPPIPQLSGATSLREAMPHSY